ncbi:cadherin repeat domain-containing protein [Photobacterium sp. SDRW27]|uniref:cadherin repeat domain-containing protein n=1 Tax=Photobacterium obscurum TaxID=2829490 RepID=UPI0022434B72|nr:cadherin repeat domain-containing protein [Photobacterium obscurum]MCW8327510.1 cadherin repeat domain-containing protein [Photobacterium obscurum]
MNYKKNILAILVGTSLILSGCGGGGSGSSESSHTPTAKPGKLQRHALEAEDISTTYYEKDHDWQRVNPKLDHRIGTTEFTIIDSEPQGMASINPASGEITVFKPGTLTVRVTDTSTVYENSEATFTVMVDKGINHSLEAQNKEIAIETSDKAFITARNNKGKATYTVSDDSRHLLEIDHKTGQLTPLAVGTATVIITDEGNDKFAPATTEAKVTIKAINASTLSFAPLSTSYSPGLLLEPWRVSGDEGAEYRYNIYSNSAPDVLSIDENTGQMTVKKVGKTVIEVTATYNDHYDRASQTAYFDVTITKGQRMAIEVESQTFPYVPGKIIQPNVSHLIGKPRFELVNEGDVVTIDKTSGYPKIIGVGSVSINAIDDSNPNYYPSNYRFSLIVEKGEHPGLKAKTVIQRTYSKDLTITPHITGQYGDLSITSTSANVAISDDEKSVTVIKAGTTNLSVTDSGGQHYHQSSAAAVVLEIARAIHPDMTVSGLTTDYSDNCFAIDNYIDGAEGEITVSSNSNPDVAEFNQEKRCIKPLKPGSTDFTLYSQQSDNYLASEVKTLPVIINQAGTTLKTSGDVWGTFGSGSIKLPTITGSHGELTYEIAENANTDVVRLSADSGPMQTLNAGTTRIKVTDSGNEQYQAATAYFNVTVKPALNTLNVSYPKDEVFEPGKRLTPAFTDLTDDMTTTFELTTSTGEPVKLINTTTGELEIQSAGEYSLKVTAVSRNYRQAELTIKGTIAKAPHPGIETKPIEIEYSPLKTYQLELGTPAIGQRVFSVSAQDNDLLIVDPNSGKLTLLGFTENKAQSKAIVRISEEDGNQNYEPLPAAAVQNVIIKAPGENVSHKDITIDQTGSIFDSRLNSTADDYRFRSLKETKINFVGTRVGAATDKQLNELGAGVNLIIAMIPEGEEDTYHNRKQVMLYVQRFDGCPDKYNRTTVSNGTAEPVAMGDYTSCGGEDTNRFLTFTVVNDQYLTPGNWQAVTPFVVYRQSERPFKPTAKGGCYEGSRMNGKIYDDCSEDGLEETSIINEWNRVDVRISK